MFCLFVVILLVVVVMGIIVIVGMFVEDWIFFEGIYFVFISLIIIGFGDYVFMYLKFDFEDVE